jgi:hypothetical protein
MFTRPDSTTDAMVLSQAVHLLPRQAGEREHAVLSLDEEKSRHASGGQSADESPSHSWMRQQQPLRPPIRRTTDDCMMVVMIWPREQAWLSSG